SCVLGIACVLLYILYDVRQNSEISGKVFSFSQATLVLLLFSKHGYGPVRPDRLEQYAADAGSRRQQPRTLRNEIRWLELKRKSVMDYLCRPRLVGEQQ